MCGIAGFYGKGSSDNLLKMTDALEHRGPDDRGHFSDGLVGLGQRRLSIIDTSRNGHQPMSNEDESVWIVFNGEIYNFLSLKDRLKQKHCFKSSSDTEVILHLYEEIGEEVFSLLEGMFAIAIYDKEKEELFLARDRMGKKPLYYHLNGNSIIFASELKALVKHRDFVKELNHESLKMYLFYEYIPTPNSIYKNTYKLEPATYLKFKHGKQSKRRFWNMSFSRQEVGNEKEALLKLDTAINDSVKDRLVSDVPLGILLSGGIDSSAICYYAQKNSSSKVKTFSIGFKESSFDESNYAREVANHLGTDHHEAILSANDSIDLIEKIGDVLDEPMADQSILPTYLLSRFTKENVTVALGGDGGDELLGGYDTFVAHRLAEFYEKMPSFMRGEWLKDISSKLPTSFSNLSLDFKIKTFLAGFEGEKKYRDARWMKAFDVNEGSMFASRLKDEIKGFNEFLPIDKYGEEFEQINSSVGFQKHFNFLTYLYLRMYMMDQVLVKVDRASMANSLEVRAPLLDSRVVDLSLSLSHKYKLRPFAWPYVFETKYIFRKLMQDKLPNDIVWRKKKGFGVPMAEWLNGPLEELVKEKLSKRRIEEQGIFDYNFVNNLITDHKKKKQDLRKPIWTLLMFQLWFDRWMK